MRVGTSQDGSLGVIHHHSRSNLWDQFGDRLGLSQPSTRPLFYLADELETALLAGTALMPRLVDAAKLAPSTVKFLQASSHSTTLPPHDGYPPYMRADRCRSRPVRQQLAGVESRGADGLRSMR